MAFEGLTDKLQNAFRKLSSKGKLTEADVKTAMREVRMALLEADVNFVVVKDFVKKVTERAVGADILASLTPGQQVIKIVNEELTALMGGQNARLTYSPQPPTIYMLCGLQGAGKTTMAGKLGNLIKKNDKKPLLVACDVYRPAAIKQLQGRGRPGRRRGVRARAGRSGADREGGRRIRALLWARSGHHRHRRTAAHRRKADAGAARRARHGQAEGDPAGRGRHDRTGRGDRRQDVQRRAGGRRRDPDQARRRHPRGAAISGARGDGQTDQVRRRRRKTAATSSRSTPTAWPRASSAWATCFR